MKLCLTLLLIVHFNVTFSSEKYLDETFGLDMAEARKMKDEKTLLAYLCKKLKEQKDLDQYFIKLSSSEKTLDHNLIYQKGVKWKHLRKETDFAINLYHKKFKKDAPVEKCD